MSAELDGIYIAKYSDLRDSSRCEGCIDEARGRHTCILYTLDEWNETDWANELTDAEINRLVEKGRFKGPRSTVRMHFHRMGDYVLGVPECEDADCKCVVSLGIHDRHKVPIFIPTHDANRIGAGAGLLLESAVSASTPVAGLCYAGANGCVDNGCLGGGGLGCASLKGLCNCS